MTDLTTPPTGSMGLTNTGHGDMGSQHSEDGMIINTEEFKGKEIRRSDTPETLLTEFIYHPDITILCESCSIYIDIRNLCYHRSYHEALATLNYKHPQKPLDVRCLLQRRNIVLKKMKMESNGENKLQPHHIRKIDEAYELLKSDLEDVYEEMKQVYYNIDTNVRGVALNCSPDCAYAIGMCSSENSHWKSHMEDVKVYQDYFGEDRNRCYLAIFDGHHGTYAAERSGSEFHHLLLHEMAKFDSKIKSTIARNFAESTDARIDYEAIRPETKDSFRVNLHQDSSEIVQNIMDMCYKKYDEIMKQRNGGEEKKDRKKKDRHPKTEEMQKTFKKTYLMMDILLSYGKDEISKVRWSGTSALTIIIQNTKSNTGSDDQEESKLAPLKEEVSGSEKSSHRYEGGIRPPEELGLIHVANAGNSRALLVRDNKAYCLTRDHTPKNPKERQRILQTGGNLSQSEKECLVNGVLSVTRGLGNHGDKKLKDCVIVDPYVTTVPIDQYAQFLVLASNGIWEVFSDEDVTSLLVKMLPDQQIQPPSRFNDSVVQLFEKQVGDSSKTVSNNGSEKTMEPINGLQQTEQQQPSQPPTADLSSLQIAGGNDIKYDESVQIYPSADDSNECETSQMEDKSPTEKQTNILVIHGGTENNGTKNVLADLHTEIGSHFSETDGDVNLHSQDHRGQSEDYICVAEHSNFQKPVPLTKEEQRRELAKSMAEHLTQAALLAGAKDNITVLVVLLPACGI